MKRCTAILFLSVYLLGSTNAYQLLKVPLLFTHYIKHKTESPYITLASFFKMHYIDPQPMDADYKEDMQLPFKTPPVTLCRHLPLFVAMQSVIAIQAPVTPKLSPPVLDVRIAPALIVNTVFQPPRASFPVTSC